MKIRYLIIASCLIALLAGCNADKEKDKDKEKPTPGGTETTVDPAIDVQVGQVLPAWQEG